MRRVALCYVRKSITQAAADRVSPERQRSGCEAEAEAHGWTPEVYEDAEGHRSGRTEDRPAWQALKAQLGRPDVVAIIAESLARASRSTRDLYNVLAELDERGIAFISLKERIDTSTAMGRAFFGFCAVMAQFESDLASERMAANIAYKREHKGRHWGLTPFGCEREGPDRVLVPSTEGVWIRADSSVVGAGVADDPPAAGLEWRGYHAALRRCYELYIEDKYGLVTIRRRLDRDGYRFRDRWGNPRKFTEDDVRRLLDAHPIYAGNVIVGRAKDRGGEILEGAHDPILPVHLCDQVAEILQRRSKLVVHLRGSPWHGRGRVYILSGLLHCAGCGRKMIGMYQDGKRRYRHSRAKEGCTAKGQALARDIEGQVFDRLRCFEIPEVLKQRIRQDVEQRIKAMNGPGLEAARAVIRRNEKRLQNLLDLRIEGEISKADYYSRKAEYEAEIQEAQAKLRGTPADVASVADLLRRVDQVAEVLAEGTPEEQKQAMAMIWERLEQVDGKLTLAVPRAWASGLFNG